MCANGIKVKMSAGFVSTPMVSLGAVRFNAALGVIITASHNPPSYNGFKLKAHYGGPSNPETIESVEKAIPETFDMQLESVEALKRRECWNMLIWKVFILMRSARNSTLMR